MAENFILFKKLNFAFLAQIVALERRREKDYD